MTILIMGLEWRIVEGWRAELSDELGVIKIMLQGDTVGKVMYHHRHGTLAYVQNESYPGVVDDALGAIDLDRWDYERIIGFMLKALAWKTD